MNLILFQASELLSSSSEEEEKNDNNDNAKTAKSSLPQSLSLHLGPQDKRTKHILGHLRKESGQEVTVGCIGGNKGKAIVHIITTTMTTATTTATTTEPQKQQQDDDDDENKKKKNKANKSKKKKPAERRIRLDLQFSPMAITTTTTTTTTIITSPSSSPISSPASPRSPLYNVTLVIALPFPKVMKSLWSTVASMGIQRIIIIKGQLSDPDHAKTSALDSSIYLPLVEDGMSQGGHTIPPRIDIMIEKDHDDDNEVNFDGVALQELGLSLSSCDDGDDDENDSITTTSTTIKLFLDCGNEQTEPPPALTVLLNRLQQHQKQQTNNQQKPSVVLAVGPERGWTDDEATSFERAGFTSVTLGKSILKVETAVIAGLGVVCSALDNNNNNSNNIIV